MVTLIIILITVLVSILCFTGKLDINALKFNAYDVWHRKQWYRMLSYGLVHGGWGHLFFNMLTLYFFGTVVEQYFQVAFGHTPGIILYVVLYVSAIAVSTIGDLVKYKDAPGYNAVGASGAVSAVLFASILFEPKMGIYIYLIPIPVPGYIFAPLYLPVLLVYGEAEHGQHRPYRPFLGCGLRSGFPFDLPSGHIPSFPLPTGFVAYVLDPCVRAPLLRSHGNPAMGYGQP